jgi:hypothetical protein
MTLNGGVESKTIEGMIRRGIWEDGKEVLSFFLFGFSKEDRWSWSRFVVVAFDFHCTNDYIMVDDMFLLVIDSVRGWCWGLMMNISI